jgi:3-dehydroquinate dehydratase/shikimate dehydrogenase
MNNGKICVSICPETACEISENARLALLSAIDLVEIRFDCLDDNQLMMVLPETKQLRRYYGKRLLITFRPKEQGGAREIKLSQRRWFWRAVLTGQLECLCDIEPDLQKKFPIFRFNPRIASYHNFLTIDENLENIYQTLIETNSEIIKIAVHTNDATDGLAVMKLLERAKSENKELIPIAMGEHGIWTRILGLSRGAFMTFASLDEESVTAPGQLTAQEMIDIYRVKELDENTEIYGLVGGSVAHSVSPEMHNAAFKFNKLNAVYIPFAVKNLEEFMHRMVNPKTREIEWKLRGFAVTIPHKIEMMRYLDFIDETAQKIGAVNTVKIEGDKLYGFNTDAQGFIDPLKNSYGNLRDAKVAVFGAGGAARAVVYALKNEGASVTVFARNLEKAKSLADDFEIEIKPITNYQLPITNYDIVVNTTPLGMRKSGLENETPLTAKQLEGVGLVYDLVYNPFETRLIKEAQSVFVPTLGGLAMLVAQAIEQQKIWTGLDAPTKEMSAAALRKL